jgi:hypothetical protein
MNCILQADVGKLILLLPWGALRITTLPFGEQGVGYSFSQPGLTTMV